MAFKLGNEKRDFKSSLNVTINRDDGSNNIFTIYNIFRIFD